MRPRSAGTSAPFARARRRDVARACSFGARTTSEIARQLATKPGSVTSVIAALTSEGILRETAVPHAEGQAYELEDAWRPALAEAVGSGAPRGQLEPEHRLLVVAGRDAGAFARAAAVIAADPVVLWAARVDGPARLIVVARGEEPHDLDQIDRLETTLAHEGVECVQLTIRRILELPELARYAKTLATAPPPPGELLAGEL